MFICLGSLLPLYTCVLSLLPQVFHCSADDVYFMPSFPASIIVPLSDSVLLFLISGSFSLHPFHCCLAMFPHEDQHGHTLHSLYHFSRDIESPNVK